MCQPWILILVIAAATEIEAVPYKITGIPEETVAVFQPLRTLRQYDQVWNLATYIDMKQYRLELNKLPGLVERVEEMCSNITAREPDDCGLMVQLNRVQLEEIQEMDRLFPRHPTRAKRGLLDVVGTIGKTLFGLMDNEDEQYFNEKVDELQEGQIKLLQFGKQQTTIMNSMVEYFNGTSTQLAKQQSELETNMQKLTEVINNMEDRFGQMEHKMVVLHQLNEVVQFVSSRLMLFRAKQRMLVQAVSIVHHQPNVPMLIHPEMLVNQLKLIQQMSGKEVELPISPEADNLRFYYQMIEPEIAILPNRLIINFKIPLVERDTFTLYHVVNLPVKETNGMYKTLVMNKPYLAVNKRRDRFLELSEKTLSSCKEVGGDLSVCRHGVTYQSPAHSSCEMDVFVNQGNIKQSCSTTSMKVTSGLWFELASEDSWIFIIPETMIGKVTGPEEDVFRVTLKGTGKLQLSPGCSLELDGVVLKAPLVSKTEGPETVYIQVSNTTFTMDNGPEKHTSINLPKVVNLLESGHLTRISQNLKELKNMQEIPLIHKTQRDQWMAWITTAVMILGMVAVYMLYQCWKKSWWKICRRKTTDDSEAGESTTDGISIMTL